MILSDIAIQQLEDLRSVIGQLSDEEFMRPLSLLDGVSIGKHIRHTLEFHQCLFAEGKVISYDKRARNGKLEEVREEAFSHIDDLGIRLRFVQLDRILNMSVQYGDHELQVTTSVQREMAFLIEHTVHHMAILRIALTACFPHVCYNPEFGYADSTIRFREQTKIAI